MRQRFVSVQFKAERLAAIEQANSIVTEYQRQGLRLTLRQLFYQHVARGLIPNTERSYKNLGELVSAGRMAGLIDWDAIEDRGRVVDRPSQWANLGQLVQAALSSYRLPRWADQRVYCELWVEKQALAGVLEPIARQFHIPLMTNKGYSSSSAMYEAAQRIDRACGHNGLASGEPPSRPCVILYLGDHDPSGNDMVRDIRERLTLFLGWEPIRRKGRDVDPLIVRKLGLTWEQIQAFNPPPNPAKLTDSRAKAYIAQFGDESWEVDALPPQELTRIITDELNEVMQHDKMEAVKAREEADKARLVEALKSLGEELPEQEPEEEEEQEPGEDEDEET